MPMLASAVESSAYLRLLVLGDPKVGKTHTTIATCEGPAYVINSDDRYALKPAARVRQDFEWDLALGDDPQVIETCLGAARKGVKEGRYKTIVWDTLTRYSDRIQEVYSRATQNAKGEPDGRRFWPAYRKHLEGVIDRLFLLKAHVIVTAHYVEVSTATIDGQIDKAGQGVVPLLGGQARRSIPAMFQDVVFLEKKGNKRRFVVGADGVFGPGCRNLDGVSECEADIGALWTLMQKKGK